MKGKILLIGAGGQLGQSISAIFESDEISEAFDLIALSHAELDVTSQKAVSEYIMNIQPDFVINATAYTAVDRAEDDVEACYAVNSLAPGFIAEACSEVNAKLIHISTDYVYNGDVSEPHAEDEPTKPTGVYAESKLGGEINAINNCKNTIILRTSWLYSPYGKNFVKTIGNLSFVSKELNVVDDQFGNPTYAPDLAKTILNIIRSDKWTPGIYNYCNSGIISWYEFAHEIVYLLGNGDKCAVNPIDSSLYPAKAKRPKYSALNCEKIRHIYGVSQITWRDSLAKMINEYPDSFNSVSNNP